MGLIDSSLKFSLLLVILAAGFVRPYIFLVKGDFEHCQNVVTSWAMSAVDTNTRNDELPIKDLLFFLHIPRTGGRSFFFCFLKKLYGPNQECPRSYDKLHFNPSKINCSLLSTHDDYSILSEIPKVKTSVVTILRDPVDRFLSSYEFSIEVAARFLLHPNLSSAIQMDSRIRSKLRGVSTLDIWPWKYLVPWMREDLFARREARKNGKSRPNHNANPYEMRDIIMPLHEYIYDRIAYDTIHNGATFQVAGITNNSFHNNAHKVRTCVQKYPNLGHLVLEVAKRRLDDMLYVGLTEDHSGSATKLFDVIGERMIFGPVDSSTSTHNHTYVKKTGPEGPFHNSEVDIFHDQDEIAGQEDKVHHYNDLLDSYNKCISTLRKSQGSRRGSSFKRIHPANFSKEARRRIPEAVLQQIISLNDLDMELYKHAQLLFSQKQHLSPHLVIMDQEAILLQDQLHWTYFVLPVFVVLVLIVVVGNLRSLKRKRLS